jgi:putative iron-only hydrogenase system regulator
VITDRKNQSANVNNILSEYVQIIIGRMGIPYREKNLGIIALIIEGNTDEIGAMTGKLGSLKGVQVKTALVSK